MVVEALLFYHPAVWWASARIRHERELCCDDLAVRACGDAVCYARALTTLERMRATAPVLAMGTTSGRLLYRIERLMGVTPQEQSPARWPGVVALAAGLACVALTTNWARGQAPAVRDEPGVKVDLGASALLHRTGVEYPEAAKKKGVQGNVTVQVTVDENGNVSDAHVLSGPEELRKSVLQSILEWHFTKDAAKSERQVGVAFQTPAAGAAEPAELSPVIFSVVDPEGQVVTQLKARLEALHSAGAVSEQQVKEMVDQAQAQADREARVRANQEALMFLEQQVEEAQRQTRGAQAQVPKNLEETYQAEVQLKRAEHAMELAKAAQAAGELEMLRAETERRMGQKQVVGRTLKSIPVFGFDDAVSGSLTARINLRVGDTLTAESMDAARKAVLEFDEHAGVEFVPTADGQVEVRILAPR
jgi:TonB family protein